MQNRSAQLSFLIMDYADTILCWEDAPESADLPRSSEPGWIHSGTDARCGDGRNLAQRLLHSH